MSTHEPNPPPPSAAPRETGRQRATRIPLDYFKKSDALTRWKLWLALLALLAASGWVAAGFLWEDRGRARYSRGPVAAVHSAWNNDCSACHVDFSPISKENLAAGLATGADHKRAADQRCESCHAGPVHHDNQKASSTPSCGSCHIDHRGVDASLVRLADSDCVQCHANVKDHLIDAGKAVYENKVTTFATDHPEFRVLKDKARDPGVIKFNHKLHMTRGLTLAAGGKGGWTLAKVPEADRDRYKAEKDGLVQLDCASCHRLDSSDVRGKVQGIPAAVLAPRAAGQYMQPITYEVACKACHPLGFDDKKPSEVVPHRLQPAALKEYLERTYAAQLLTEKPELLEKPFPPLPGKSGEPAQGTARKYIDEKVRLALDTLYAGKKTCGECHTIEKDANGKPARIVAGLSGDAAPKWFQHTASIPPLWFLHARFDHAAHRAVDCRGCHENAYAEKADGTLNPQASVSHTDILLPGIANCRTCHAPRHTEGGATVGGVRHECTECHNYHHGEQPLAGIGALPRAPARKTDSLKKFLQGKME